MMLSQNLQQLMKRQGLTVTDMARRTEIAAPLIHRMAQGDYVNPSLTTLRKLAMVFHITLSQFVGEEPLPDDLCEPIVK